MTDNRFTDIQTYKDRVGKWRARLRADNGRIIWITSQGHERRDDLERAIDILVEVGAEEPVGTSA